MTGEAVPTELFNRDASVRRKSSQPDGAGGWVEAWAEATVIRVRCSQPSTSETESAQAGQAAITHVVYTPPGADVWRGDRLHVADLVLDVDSVVEPSEPIYRRAACVSVQHEK